MQRIIIIILLLFIYESIFSQSLPTDFDQEKVQLLKVTDSSPNSNTIEDILFVNGTIWLATSKGVSKSEDNGKIWESYNFGDDGVSAIGNNNGTIWIATWRLGKAFGQDVGVGTGLHYTEDNGDNWSNIPQPIDSLKDSTITYGINTLRTSPIHTNVFNFTRSIKFTKDAIWIASTGGYFRKSLDGGKTWKIVVVPPDYLDSIHPEDTLNFTISLSEGTKGYESNLNYSAFSIKILNDSTIYLGSAGGINLSTDGGISWRKFNHTNQANPISGNHILDLKYDSSSNTLWAATWKANGDTEFYAVSKTSDSGKTWETFLTGEKVQDLGFKFGRSNDIFAASENGIFRSNNGGLSWITAPEIIDDNSKLKITSTHFLSVAVQKIDENTTDIWLGSTEGLARLRENNGSWNGAWKVYISSPNILSSSEAIAFPNPFSPDSEPIKIKYSFKDGAKKVSLRIFDFGMNLVKTVLQNVDRTNDVEYLENWDGRNENNNIVPNGVYFYRIDIGNDEPLFGKIIVLM